jgi:hypothetical protein
MQGAGLDSNRRLAQLLGWTNIFDVGGALLGTPPAGESSCRGQAKVPNWSGDWRDCGPLMVEHLHAFRPGAAWMTADLGSGLAAARQFGDGESAGDAARRVIVDAVIMKLEISR